MSRPGEGIERLLTLAEATEFLGISEKMLRFYMGEGALKHIAFGRGVRRQRRMFHPDDLAEFVDRQRRSEPCQSTDRATRRESSRRRSTTTTSNSSVVAFTALLAAERSQRQKNTSGRGGWKPQS